MINKTSTHCLTNKYLENPDHLLKEHTTHIESQLIHYLPKGNSKLEQAMRYGVLNGGKRFRPLLCYATADAFGIQHNLVDPFASALEFIHAYSLIHDDLPAMDNDKLRRGKPTCHIKFDEATAILAGDALQALAFEIITESTLATRNSLDLYKLIHLLASSCGYSGMAGGQAIDLAAVGKKLSTIELIDMHQLKTGKLIQAAVLGTLYYVENISTEIKQQIAIYANNIGLAFQIKDDILDEIGDDKVIGKHTGQDKILNKPTFPLILGMEKSEKLMKKLIEEAHSALSNIQYNTKTLAFLANFMVHRQS